MTAPEPWPSEQNQCTVCAAEWDGPEDTAGCPSCCYWENDRDSSCECEWCDVPGPDVVHPAVAMQVLARGGEI